MKVVDVPSINNFYIVNIKFVAVVKIVMVIILIIEYGADTILSIVLDGDFFHAS